ncbi:MAG: hypothetical protein ACRDQU_12080 [Pseudonocardiaceae bacterium]
MNHDLAMDNLWALDARVLAAIARAVEIDGQQVPEISEILCRPSRPDHQAAKATLTSVDTSRWSASWPVVEHRCVR